MRNIYESPLSGRYASREMLELFSAVPEAIENTKKIADMCNFEFSFDIPKLPRFKTPNGEKAGDYCEVKVASVTSATLICTRLD